MKYLEFILSILGIITNIRSGSSDGLQVSNYRKAENYDHLNYEEYHKVMCEKARKWKEQKKRNAEAARRRRREKKLAQEQLAQQSAE